MEQETIEKAMERMTVKIEKEEDEDHEDHEDHEGGYQEDCRIMNRDSAALIQGLKRTILPLSLIANCKGMMSEKSLKRK